MAKEILVTELLSEQMISAGESLLRKLDESSCCVKAAFWIFLPDEKIWQLIIASPLVKEEGPKEYYKRIFDVGSEDGTDENIISLHDISVSDTDTQLVQLLTSAAPTGEALDGIRFSKNSIQGVFIDDAYIYRMNVN